MTRIKIVIVALLLLIGLHSGAQNIYGVSDSVARSRAVEYHYLQARSYMEQDSLDRCLELLEHCHELDPGSLIVMYDLSYFYAYLGRDSLACDMLEHIVEKAPDNIFYNDALANHYLNAGDIDSAIKVYEELLDKVDSKRDMYIRLHYLYTNKGEHLKVIDLLEKLEKIDGVNEEMAINKVHHYTALNDSVKAIDAILNMIRENPDEPRYKVLLGNTYYNFGDRKKALDCLNGLLSVKSDDILALGSLVEVYATDDNDSLYCDAVERLLVCEDLDTETRMMMLVQYIEYKNPTDSVRVMNLLGKMNDLPFDELEIAEVYSRYLISANASPDTIVPVFEKIYSLDPENVWAIVRLLSYAANSNDTEAVFKYADKAISYLPYRLEPYYYKGLSQYMLGKKEESVETYLEGLAKRADDTEPETISKIYALLGDTYQEIEMDEECVQAYDSALVYDNNNVDVLNNYAYYLAVAGVDLERALEMSHKTLLQEPESVTYLDTYAWILFRLGRYEEAKAYAEKMISRGEELSSEVYHHCGDIFAKCGDTKRAVDYWIKARDAGDLSEILAKKIRKQKYYNDAKRNK